jgi:hypothetical protein
VNLFRGIPALTRPSFALSLGVSRGVHITGPEPIQRQELNTAAKVDQSLESANETREAYHTLDRWNLVRSSAHSQSSPGPDPATGIS